VSELLFHAHSGLRYLVLLAGVGVVAWGFLAEAGSRPFGRGARVLNAAFTGLLDLQILIGVATLLARAYFPALIGHIVLMVLAAAVVHGAAVADRRAARVRPRLRAIAALAALLLIAAGILAIGRPVL
jgi:hypothetical protein